ncbi:MAG: hypothetical protein HQL87_03835 [Magnetococcales bacterium]|nr:hypothetical protein [Magnetococcales bacterium]
MKPRRTTANPKRKIAAQPDSKAQARLDELAGRVGYGGNPEHKRHPGDFGLTPPSQPRPDKALCDDAGIFTRLEATRLLQAGVRKGLISLQKRNGWPQNIWAVNEQGIPFEAQLENAEQGQYHGYPMPEADPLRHTVLERWQSS